MKGFLLVKPDYVSHTTTIVNGAHGLIDERSLPLSITGTASLEVSREFIEGFYAPQSHVPHFPVVVDYWSDSQSTVIWLEGENVVRDTLLLAGQKTDPDDCSSNELRGLCAHLIPHIYRSDPNQRKLRNIVHRSDSEENRARELRLIEGLLSNP